MKTSFKIVYCTVFLLALLAVSCGSPQTTENEAAVIGSELMGVWKISGATIEFPPDLNQETIVHSPHLPGIFIFAKKHYSWVDFHGESIPDLPEEPTDAQVAAVYGQLTAEAGTYEVKGSSIILAPIVSKNPKDMSSAETFNGEFAFEGDVLTISWKIENQMSLTLKLKKLE